MLVHDVIIMRLVDQGYLPNYPYHLISKEEMCDAFLIYTAEDTDEDWEAFKNSTELSFFKDKYPLLDDSLESEYRTLISSIAYHIEKFKESKDDLAKLPDWVYSYMLESVISVDSPKSDIHDMLVLMDIDNVDDDFLPIACEKCYFYSTQWLSKLPVGSLDHRPPTIFGEPHVLKLLRILNLDVLTR